MKKNLKNGFIDISWGPTDSPMAAKITMSIWLFLMFLTIVGTLGRWWSTPIDEISISSWEGYSIAQGVKEIEDYKEHFWRIARQELSGTPLEMSEGYFYELRDLGIDPVFGLAVARHESQYGKIYLEQNLNHSEFDKNPFGIMIQSGPYNLRRFGSYRDAILSHFGFGGVIQRVYLARGLDSIEKIAPVYCVDGGKQGAWGDRVEEIYIDLWKQIKQA